MLVTNVKYAKCFLLFHLLVVMQDAVKSLMNHPQRFLDGHQNSFKHINATKQYEGIISFNSR